MGSAITKKRRRRPWPFQPTAEPPFQDLIARAFAREREHTRVLPWPPEYELVFAHCFNCVCCGKTRGEELRREPTSEVCIHCVAAAGFSPN